MEITTEKCLNSFKSTDGKSWKRCLSPPECSVKRTPQGQAASNGNSCTSRDLNRIVASLKFSVPSVLWQSGDATLLTTQHWLNAAGQPVLCLEQLQEKPGSRVCVIMHLRWVCPVLRFVTSCTNSLIWNNVQS